MAALNTTQNKNPLSPLGFRFLIEKLPNVEYFVNTVSLPAVSTTFVEQPNPLGNRLVVPSGRLNYETLTIGFIVDEDMENYRELHNWLLDSTHVDNQERFAASTVRGQIHGQGTAFYSDASLIIMTSNQNPNLEVVFENIAPLDISTLEFKTNDTDVTYLEASATFVFRRYKINSLQ